MPGKPLPIDQLLIRFREALFRLTIEDANDCHNSERAVIQGILSQNQEGSRRELLERELEKVKEFRSLNKDTRSRIPVDDILLIIE